MTSVWSVQHAAGGQHAMAALPRQQTRASDAARTSAPLPCCRRPAGCSGDCWLSLASRADQTTPQQGRRAGGLADHEGRRASSVERRHAASPTALQRKPPGAAATLTSSCSAPESARRQPRPPEAWTSRSLAEPPVLPGASQLRTAARTRVHALRGPAEAYHFSGTIGLDSTRAACLRSKTSTTKACAWFRRRG